MRCWKTNGQTDKKVVVGMRFAGKRGWVGGWVTYCGNEGRGSHTGQKPIDESPRGLDEGGLEGGVLLQPA